MPVESAGNKTRIICGISGQFLFGFRCVDGNGTHQFFFRDIPYVFAADGDSAFIRIEKSGGNAGVKASQ
uniref:Uncharacterized protein n=1 Tax=Eubacterium cellulosolvens (strain ATCC 43171 / JCM 9499 / 6) TaxID=633697 RepID=I5AWY8_EUBC6